MAELKNTFSWSFSAAEDFEQCRRRRYWSKYASWGGWSPSAPQESRIAYRLNKMDNVWGLMGQAAENAAVWLLRERQRGRSPSAEEAWEKAARPFLTRKWNESLSGAWRRDPKRVCCLREHYYGTLSDEKQTKRDIADQVKRCIANFRERVLPRLAAVRPEQEIAVSTPEKGGEAEHFFYADVKVYAIPDYAWREGKLLHIHDWKAGKAKESHRLQLSIYALWARIRHGFPPDRTFLYVEYLKDGKVFPFQVSEEELQTTIELMSDSVAAMTEYLVDGDRKRNEPLPKEEWELTDDPRNCRQCNFYELCRPELEAPPF